MSFKKKFNKFIHTKPGTTVGLVASTIFAPISLFIDPTGGVALFACGSMILGNSGVDVVASNIKREWKNAAGQTLKGSEQGKKIFEGCEKSMIKSLAEYDDATTEIQRQKATANFHDTLNLLEQFFGDVKILSVDNVEEYRFGFQEISFQPTQIEKPISIQKRAGKFGV